MSDRYMNDQACGIEPEHEGEEPTLEQWRDRCRQLWAENVKLRAALAPFAGLELPKKPVCNAGAWSLLHNDIRAAKAAMTEPPDVSHGFHLFMDGNMWCAVGPHFRDLQQDRAGFGHTKQAAYEAWWRDNEHSANFRAVVHSKPDISVFTVHQ